MGSTHKEGCCKQIVASVDGISIEGPQLRFTVDMLVCPQCRSLRDTRVASIEPMWSANEGDGFDVRLNCHGCGHRWGYAFWNAQECDRAEERQR